MEIKKFTIPSPSSILVRMPNWLGDLVMATPILADLKQKWPNAKITAMCQGPLASVIQYDPHVDELLTFKKPRGVFSFFRRKELDQLFQNKKYDLGVLLTNSLSTAWWFWRGWVKHRIGFATFPRSLLLDIPVRFPKSRNTEHLVKTYKNLLEPLNIPVSKTSPKIYVTEEETKQAKEKLAHLGVKETDFILGINPGAAFGSAKCWIPDRFKSLTHELQQKYPTMKIVYFGDKNGAPLVKEICAAFQKTVINLAGQTTLREFISLIGCCDLFLTNDSGPMHVASALGIPLIALFGSTSDQATGPYSGGLVIHKRVSCSPCYRRECPIDFRCMTRITVDEVFNAIQNNVRNYDLRQYESNDVC